MKKINKFNKVLVLSTLVTSSLLVGSPAFAEDVVIPISAVEPIKAVEDNIQKADVSNFMKVSGVISKINQNDTSLTLIVKNEDQTVETHFPISDEVLLFNSGTTAPFEKERFQEGQHVEVYYDKHKPMIMIYPARITPEIVIVKDVNKNNAVGQVKVAMFDENLVSLDHQLKLKLDKNTVLLNEKGEEITAAELRNQELIAFYTISTKSIPAQTAPSKVIVLNIKNKRMLEELQSIINDDFYVKNETMMIPIRDVAEQLGYDVKWNNATSTITVNKETHTFQITIGKEDYHFNQRFLTLQQKPEIKNGTTYVPADLFEMLKTN